VLICLANTSSNYQSFATCTGFAVNVLAEDQIDVSNTFAKSTRDRFADVPWHTGPAGAPILKDVCAWFDCSLHKTVEAGDHLILLGHVDAFDSVETPGLGYARGAYVTPSSMTEALAPNIGLIVSALIEHAGKVLLVDDGKGGMTLPTRKVGPEGTSAALDRLIRETRLNTQPGFIYSVFENTDQGQQHISFLCQTAEDTPARGTFVSLQNGTFDGVADPAILTMLKRFANESRFGNFGIYYGDRTQGQVRPLQGGK
jgi:hypothetical protein